MLDSVRNETIQERAFDEIIRKFGEIVSQDKTIQTKLSAAIDSGMAKDDWIALYVGLAREQGLAFSAGQMKIAMQEQKQGKDKILPSIVQRWVSLL
ncbi:MAG TPA: hypothetical protein VLI72_08655 [Methylibium sp.]|nr:hypothetical protein [Methylibium sp.]